MKIKSLISRKKVYTSIKRESGYVEFVMETSRKGDVNGQWIGIEVNIQEVMNIMIQCEKGCLWNSG